MSRRAMIKDLPPIEEAFAAFTGFKPGFSRQQALTMALRECAVQLQRDKPRLFYSIREVAAHLSTPLRTTALSYRTLDMEGLLHRIRGSYTMLAGRKVASRQAINGIVGLPIWLTSMIISPFECALQMEMDEQLRARGFVADSIFFKTGEDCEPDFAERLLCHNLDILIWQSPHPLSSHVLLSMRERGVRLILLQSVESSLSIPARSYLCDWQPAYRQMAAHWQSEGIRRVIVPRPSHHLSHRALKNLIPILESRHLEVVSIEAEEKALAAELEKATPTPVTPKRDVLAFIDLQTADTLCNGHPDLIEKMLVHMRLAFCRGPVRIHRLATKRIPVDVVQLDPESMVKGVLADLCDPEQIHEGFRQTFVAGFSAQIIMKSSLEQEPA